MTYIIKKHSNINSIAHLHNHAHVHLFSIKNTGLPSAEYEIKRRRVGNGVLEMWFYVQSELIKLGAMYEDKDQEMVDRLQFVYNMTAEHYR